MFALSSALVASSSRAAEVRVREVRVETGAGVLGYTNGVVSPGPAFVARFDVLFTRRWGFEANYEGALNRRKDAPGSLLSTSIDACARYNILRPGEGPLLPYVAAGIGYAAFTGPGGDKLTITLPFYVGIERRLNPTFLVGARFIVRPALFDDISIAKSANGQGLDADTWSVVGHASASF